MKKFKNRVLLIIGVVLLTIFAVTALLAAGQYFQLLPYPQFMGIGAIAGIVILLIGFAIGKYTNPKE